MYVAVKGGEKAIDAAHALQESRRRGDTDLPELSVAQIEQQLNLAVDRVMTEGGIADRELAALALKQASGDNVEAIFLLRAYRTTLAKLAVSEPLDTTEMRLERRISAVYKDIPGGQLLGPTYDYTHRLLDFTLLANGEAPTLTTADSEQQPSPHVFSLLARQGLAKFEEDSGAQPDDITRTPPVYPCSRSSRLQQLMRGDEGYLLALAYSTQRGYGRNHPFAGEIRSGYIDVSIVPEELGFAVNVGELLMTECEMVNGFIDPPDEPPHFTRGYGLVFGMSERKAMAMALVDRALQAPEYGEHATGPAQDEEFVLAHADNVEAAGFVSHLKLPTTSISRPNWSYSNVCNRRRTMANLSGYNFAYLDEQTKRMIRRAILKAVAIPGYQVPFGGREMPMPYGWGTGGIQLTASVIGESDVLKVIDQGADDTTNAVSIRNFFKRVTGVNTTERTDDATLIQTRHRIPETPLTEDQIIIFQVPIPEPLRFIEPRETETRTMHALEEYGVMQVKLYEDIARFGHIATTYAYPVKVNGRYVMDPSPIPKFDNPKMDMMPALQLFGAGREKRIYAVPPFTRVESLDFDDHPFTVQQWDEPCAICGSTHSYLDEVVLDDAGNRMFVCSDTDYCRQQSEAKNQ